MQGELNATVVNLVAAKQARYSANAQILIYCPSIAKIKRIGKLLQCSAYYYKIATDKEKAYIVQAFTAGVEKLCTATTILTLGIHAPRVQVVIHITMCNLLINLVQESRQAG
jgi:superfamily II DNA helicase RecQ